MQVTTEKIDNHTTVLNMEIPQAELAKAIESAYKKIAAQVNIAGFRKGKAPRKVIEARIGKKALLDEAFDLIAPKAYSDALTQEDIEPVSPPKIDVVTLDETQPLVFKATVTGKPKVVLGQYKELSVAKDPVTVSEEDVLTELEKVRKRHAKMVVPEEGAELLNDDLAIIDFAGFIGDEPFEGGKGESYPLRIGSGAFIPGFEEQLIGAKTGEERDILVTFPENYQAAELAGKEAKFTVKIQDIKRQELPELDDELAKELGDGEFETLDEYKEHLKQTLTTFAEAQAERAYINNLVQKATDNATFEVPDLMVENQLDGMLESMDYNLQMRGLNLDAYLAYNKRTIEDLRSERREEALAEVRNELTLSAIAKAENMTVTADDLKAEAEEMAQAYGTTADDILKASLKTNRLGALESTVLRKKAAQFILDNAAQA
ncbi:MAG: trigger factor [Sporomusaceae bacterium]|jgi:trigger factor|nr:trigger factor [Sporomusaceae bacterium]